MIKLGRYDVTYAGDPDEYAEAYRVGGYKAAYMPDVQIENRDEVKAVVKAFADRNIIIGEAGAWRNLVAHDAVQRHANLDYAIRQLAVADEMGVVACVAFHGTVGHAGDGWGLSDNFDYGPHPDNVSEAGFERAVETARYVIDAVKPKRTKFSFEMVPWFVTGTPERYLDLLKAVDRPMFGAHIDAANMIVSPSIYFNSGDMLRETFELLGRHIVSAHAKDIVMQGGPGRISFHMDEVPPGEGNLDYAAYLTCLDGLGRDVPLMLEHFTAPEYDRGRDHIRNVADELKIAL